MSFPKQQGHDSGHIGNKDNEFNYLRGEEIM